MRTKSFGGSELPAKNAVDRYGRRPFDLRKHDFNKLRIMVGWRFRKVRGRHRVVPSLVYCVINGDASDDLRRATVDHRPVEVTRTPKNE